MALTIGQIKGDVLIQLPGGDPVKVGEVTIDLPIQSGGSTSELGRKVEKVVAAATGPFSVVVNNYGSPE